MYLLQQILLSMYGTLNALKNHTILDIFPEKTVCWLMAQETIDPNVAYAYGRCKYSYLDFFWNPTTLLL